MKPGAPAAALRPPRNAPVGGSAVRAPALLQPQSRALLLALLLALLVQCAAPPPLQASALPQRPLSSAAVDCNSLASLVDLPQRARASPCAQRCPSLERHGWYRATMARCAACALNPLLALVALVWMLLHAARLATKCTPAPVQPSFGHPWRRASSRALRTLLLALLPLGGFSQGAGSTCTYVASINNSNAMYNCSTVGSTNVTTNCSGCLHQVLVVAGGGGGAGAGSTTYASGGGGAGGFLTGNFTGIGTFAVAVGAGGSGGDNPPSNGNNGYSSSINGTLLNLRAIGGGGGSYANNVPGSGGSGGGVGSSYSGSTTIVTGTTGQGFSGSLFGWQDTSSVNYYAGSGGGGAWGLGDCGRCANATSLTACPASGCSGINTAPWGGNGGNGATWTYTGLAEYAGGGGGSASQQQTGALYLPRGGVCLLGGGGAGAAVTGCSTVAGFNATKFGGGGGAAARGPGIGCGSVSGGFGYQGIVLIAVILVRTSPPHVSFVAPALTQLACSRLHLRRRHLQARHLQARHLRARHLPLRQVRRHPCPRHRRALRRRR